MKNIIEETEKKLFEEIQVMVERLPWNHEVNLRYFDACIHESAHATALVRMTNDLGDPGGVTNIRLVVTPEFDLKNNKLSYFKGSCSHNPHEYKYLTSIVQLTFYCVTGLSGSILSDEFYHYFYGWDKVTKWQDIKEEYGAISDFNRASLAGRLKMRLAISLLRKSYSDPLVRLTHLQILRDLLKNNGILNKNQMKKYLNR